LKVRRRRSWTPGLPIHAESMQGRVACISH
jgi:hypothetical protein